MADWRKRLSNFWRSEISVDGKRYPSVEHAFHAAKAKCSNKPELANEFEIGGMVGADPAAAKKAGGRAAFKKSGASLDLAKWDAERDTETLKALRARLDSDQGFRSILQATAQRDLHLLHFERQGRKSYWGGCIDQATGEAVGANRLGEMLMELRKEAVVEPDAKRQKSA